MHPTELIQLSFAEQRIMYRKRNWRGYQGSAHSVQRDFPLAIITVVRMLMKTKASRSSKAATAAIVVTSQI